MGGGVVGARHASPYGEGVVGRARGLAPTGDRREGFHPISLGLMSPRCHCEERVPERRSNPLNRVAQEGLLPRLGYLPNLAGIATSYLRHSSQ